jgi:phosphopantothenoylcysteine decarboxylase / phosphopantothenate---cysteine ligase
VGLGVSLPWRGRSVLITSGPTREYLDPIRYLTNASSGRMGFALARAARSLGAEVVVVSGPTALKPPSGIRMVPVTTALQMRREVLGRSRAADAVIGAAAVGDWRFERRSRGKVKKTGRPWSIRLVPNPDILAELGRRRRSGRPVLVGFALETGRWLHRARIKLVRKGLDIIVANRQPSLGGPLTNFALLTRGGRVLRFPDMDKRRAAFEILRAAEPLLRA